MLLNHNDAKCYASFDIIISRLHEMVQKFMLYNVICSCRTLVYCSQNRLADQTFYGRLLLLSKSSWLNICVGK